MASVWVQGPGHPAKKLVGHLDANAALGRFQVEVAKLAKGNKAKVVSCGPLEALLRWPDGLHFLAYLELASPPSAPEEGQPKIIKGHGVLRRGKTIHELGVPQ